MRYIHTNFWRAQFLIGDKSTADTYIYTTLSQGGIQAAVLSGGKIRNRKQVKNLVDQVIHILDRDYVNKG
jgi:hypothetical protein